MKKISTIICFLFLASIAKAQTVKEFQLNFETNSYEISKANEALLDNEITTLKSTFYKSCKIEITGYTDNTGSVAFNKTLSENRAKSITDYFVQKGFSKNNIISKGNSDKNPVADNATEDGKSKNRRVNVRISLNFNDVLSINKFREKPDTYTFKNQKGYSFTYKSGTKISIPENSFVDKDGKEVTGDIEINYQEYRKPIDFILGGIRMDVVEHGKTGFFNSAGMFKISAFQNDEAIFLKDGNDIKVDFNLTSRLANLNLYGLDTISNNWQELAKVTNPAGLMISMGLRCGYTERDTTYRCRLDLCQSLHFINTKGIEYAQSSISLFDQANYTDSESLEKIQQTIKINREKIVTNNNKFKSISNKLKNNKVRYRLEQSGRKENNVLFTMTEVNGRQSLGETFSKAIFKSSKDDVSNDIFTKDWAICLIQKSSPNDYMITLKDSVLKKHIMRVTIETKKRVRKKKREAYMTDLLSLMNKNSIEVNAMDSLRQNLASIKTILENDTNILANYKKGSNYPEVNKQNRRDINCFFQYSQKIMPDKELAMNYNTWLKYFDANKPMMLARYIGIIENEDFKKCLEAEAEAEKERQKYLEMQRQAQLNDRKTMSLFQSMTISNMGIYNYDVIINVENPVEMLAEYEDEKGKTIVPNFVYLIDSNINGIVRYDGFSTNYNPSRFAYNPNSKNALLVFDEDGESYLFSSKKFTKLNQREKGKQLLRVQKIKDRADLENEF